MTHKFSIALLITIVITTTQATSSYSHHRLHTENETVNRELELLEANTSLPGVNSFATSTALPNVIVAMIDTGNPDECDQLRYSLDGGRFWRTINPPPRERGCVITLAVVPRDQSNESIRLIADTYQAFYRSGDFGQSWAPIDTIGSLPGNAGRSRDVEVSQADPRRIYVAQGSMNEACPTGCGVTLSGRVWRSSDAGVMWEEITPPTDRYFAYYGPIMASPVLPQRVYVADMPDDSGGRELQSDNGGREWRVLDMGMPSLLDSQDPDIQYFRRYRDNILIWERSTDGGRTKVAWEPACNASGILPHPALSLTLFQQCEDGLYRSHNGGDSWERISDSPGQLLAPDYGKRRLLWARDDGLFASSDAGDTWVLLSNDFGPPPRVFVPLLRTQ